jgi:hypothetical protein
VKIGASFGIPLALVVAFSAAGAQTSEVKAVNPPRLKLELIPLKTTYKRGETPVVQYRLTSLVDGTLCFPPPSTSAQLSETGYLQTVAWRPSQDVGVDDLDVDVVVKRYQPAFEHGKRLRASVLNRWARLGMQEPYLSEKSPISVPLDKPGKWFLRATYSPPFLTKHDTKVVKSMGCMPPGSSVESETVTITVVDSSH